MTRTDFNSETTASACTIFCAGTARPFATAGLETDAKWQEEICLEAAMQLQPEVPKTLQGELRKYQREGFTRLHRLDALGAEPAWQTTWDWANHTGHHPLLSKAHEGPAW